MRGMLYESFLLNRKWFFFAGIIAAIGTAVCAIMIANPNRTPESVGVAGAIFIAVLALSITVCSEWLGRHLESNLKCRFVDVTLAGGISKNRFVMSLMAENLISLVIGFLMCLAMNGVIAVTDKAVGGDIPFWDVFYIKLAVAIALLVGVFDFISYPLIIKFKSAEKAGLTIGVVLGFAILLFMLPFNWYKYNVSEEINLIDPLRKFMDAPYFIPVIIGAAAVIYAIVYAVLLNRVKKGDVC